MDLFIQHILLFCGAGAIVGLLTSWLDNALDFGHIFGRIRYLKAVKYAKDLSGSEGHRIRADLGSLNDNSKFSNFPERLDAANTIYWTIAMSKRAFMPWVCVFCMSGRLSIVALGIYTGLSIVYGAFAWYVPLIGFFIIVPVARLFAIKSVG